jgi:hypothetical protein
MQEPTEEIVKRFINDYFIVNPSSYTSTRDVQKLFTDWKFKHSVFVKSDSSILNKLLNEIGYKYTDKPSARIIGIERKTTIPAPPPTPSLRTPVVANVPVPIIDRREQGDDIKTLMKELKTMLENNIKENKEIKSQLNDIFNLFRR